MRKRKTQNLQKRLIGLFMGSLILPSLIYSAFYKYFDTANNENRELSGFPEI